MPPFTKALFYCKVSSNLFSNFFYENAFIFFESDDRSERNSARFYETRIIINRDKIDSVVFTGVKFLKNNSGDIYPNAATDPYHTPDPEALRYDSKNNTFV
ncbi:MAG: esterase-like activity of phytase family protein, partial [Ginsengibacter sp.]